ncbi:Por secretion system C-terminal sorting domain-containing protein [Cyclonatronum proteinivorum]|uniref:Por secretion system C-terminal sorting domain-containing protein n=1 Tax=Cyclonatronum proteinivorum TaxID=1457365 RepID=A0A345UN09_9BACT|nr:CHRD domain-containing protein [Cyclonatronum proteinivorum]AXJ01861.1 Por secretion system C-terminal sorting domain-containing protein [Cyclonatronum proteinivorum]
MKKLFTSIASVLLMIFAVGLTAQAQQTFDVTVESVNESHPNFGNTFPVVYVIDGVQGAELTLQRGETYTFNVDASGHPFFLSVQEEFNGYEGEITDGVVNSRVQNGVLTFTPGDDLPDVIWYQCGFHADMGWKINLTDAPEFQNFTAFLSGSSEVPPVFTAATGMVEASLNGSELTLTGTFEGLSTAIMPVGETGVHIHAGFTGENGPVEVILNPVLSAGNTAGTFDETVTLTPDQANLLQQRGMYINIHTERHPAGELRGQLLPSDRTIFQAYASGGFEVPANTSTAQGGLSLEWDGSTLVVTGAFSGLIGDYIEEVGNTGSGAHLHRGFAGENGGVDVSLTPTVDEDGRSGIFEAANNTFENVPAEIVSRLADRGHYLNIHSEAFPAGEIRGQVLPQANIYFYAPLSGAFEIPQNTSQATGAVFVEWYASDSSIVATGSFAGLESDYNLDIGSHFHNGPAGQNGGVDLVLNPVLGDDNRSGTYLPADNTFTLTAEDVNALVSRSWYVNIHSTDIPPGEIRGQVLPLAQHYFYAALTGLTEVQPVQTEAFGGIAVELRGTELTLSGSFNDLESNFLGSPGVHIHEGAAGTNGGIVFDLNPQLDSADDARNGIFDAGENVFSLSMDELVQLVSGELYVNVHSVDNMPGEIRGQLLLAPNRAPATAPEITFPADGATLVLEGAGSTPFEPEWTAAEDADGDLLVYVWELALDADFEDSVLQLSTGEATAAPLTFGTVDALLADLGVAEGESVTVWHRAFATDGSGFNTGDGASVTLQRGVVTSVNEGTELAGSFRLEQNYPNPFNPVTNIRYELPAAGNVQLSVYNMLGQRVALLVNETQSAGIHTVQFDGSRLSSGVYLYRLETEGTQLTRRMMLVK